VETIICQALYPGTSGGYAGTHAGDSLQQLFRELVDVPELYDLGGVVHAEPWLTALGFSA